VTNPLGLQALQLPITITHIVASGIIVVAIVVGALSLVARFRRARGIERQQLRWVALAAVLASLAVLVTLAGMALRNTALLPWAFGISFAVLPPAIGAAILRYGLYDLDRILSRTLAYGLLTVVSAGGYAAVVLGLGQLLGHDSSLVVAAATLAVAALSSRPAAVSRPWSTTASTAAAMTPPARSPPSAAAYVTRWTWTPCTASCWPSSTRPCSQPRRRCGCGHKDGPTLWPRPPSDLQLRHTQTALPRRNDPAHHEAPGRFDTRRRCDGSPAVPRSSPSPAAHGHRRRAIQGLLYRAARISDRHGHAAAG
jgi:hypothetical protein